MTGVQTCALPICKQVLDNEDICEVNMIESLVHDTFIQSRCEEPLKACLTLFDCNLDTKKSMEEVNVLLNFVPLLSIDSWQPKVVPFPLSSSLFPSIIESPKLDDFWEHQLISILQEHKEAIGWKIVDIKDISPFVVMHRIHLEEIAKASQHVFDPGKLLSHWTSPFIICIIYLHGVVEVWMVCLSRLISTCVKSFCQKKKKNLFLVYFLIFD